MRHHTLLSVSTLSAVLLVVPARAADALATDRPDFVESSLVVGTGVVQIETSLAQDRDNRDGERTTVWGTPTLFRVGISDTVELRLETDGYLRASTKATGMTSKQSGAADASLGLKWHMDDGGGAMPSTALLLHVDLDSGSAAFRRSGNAPSARIVGEWTLPSDMSLGIMGGAVWDRDETGKRFRSGILAATMGKSFTEQWRGFVELSGQALKSKRYGGNEVTLDVGTAYLIDDDTQIDAAISKGMNNTTTDTSWTIGLSRRFR